MDIVTLTARFARSAVNKVTLKQCTSTFACINNLRCGYFKCSLLRHGHFALILIGILLFGIFRASF